METLGGEAVRTAIPLFMRVIMLSTCRSLDTRRLESIRGLAKIARAGHPEYQNGKVRRAGPPVPKGVAKVAAARKLAVRLYWMLRSQVGYPEIVRIESSPRVALVGAS